MWYTFPFVWGHLREAWKKTQAGLWAQEDGGGTRVATMEPLTIYFSLPDQKLQPRAEGTTQQWSACLIYRGS